MLKIIVDKGNLKRHKQTVHKGKRLLNCQKCSLSFGLKSSLQVHINTVHENLSPFLAKFAYLDLRVILNKIAKLFTAI
jgi:hypothetical protein